MGSLFAEKNYTLLYNIIIRLNVKGWEAKMTIVPNYFVDFSSAAEDMARQDLSFSKQLEAELLADETLREGLGPLDFSEIQMLSDPAMNLISDGVEDHFRLDHRS